MKYWQTTDIRVNAWVDNVIYCRERVVIEVLSLVVPNSEIAITIADENEINVFEFSAIADATGTAYIDITDICRLLVGTTENDIKITYTAERVSQQVTIFDTFFSANGIRPELWRLPNIPAICGVDTEYLQVDGGLNVETNGEQVLLRKAYASGGYDMILPPSVILAEETAQQILSAQFGI